MRFVIRSAVGLGMMLAAFYLVFWLPLGRRTLYEHVERIVQTRPARELGEGVKETAVGVADNVVGMLPRSATAQLGNPTASTPADLPSAKHPPDRHPR